MKGMFLKSPTVRMGSQNYMRGTTETLTSSRPLGGCALLSVTLRGAGGGGGGGAYLTFGSDEIILSTDGERGSSGSLVSNQVVSVRPSTAGYSHANGGNRGQAAKSAGDATAGSGSGGLSSSLAGVVASGGSGGRGAQVDMFIPENNTNYNRVPANVQNPDGVSTAGRGGFGGNKDSTQAPFYGSSGGQSSRAWMTILD